MTQKIDDQSNPSVASATSAELEGGLCVGDKIWFKGEKRPYTIIASNDRYLICTKPFVAIKTVIYTIVDLSKNIRGTENTIFEMGMETEEYCNNALKRLTVGDSQISHRNRVALEVTKTQKAI